MTLVQVNNVSKKIGKKNILKNISLSVGHGEVVGIKGINGSGKTILLKVISGLLSSTTGEVVIDNKQLGKEIEFPESIGILIEYPKLISNYTGFQNLKFLSMIKGNMNDSDITQIMERVDLSPTSKKKFKKYSLGMKQRLGIAQAFMENQQLILLDEPTNALDEEGIAIVENLIHEAKELNKTIILTSHDSLFIERVSDSIYTIREGTLNYEA